MRIRFGESALPKSEFLNQYVHSAIHKTNIDILYLCRNTYEHLVRTESEHVDGLMYNIYQQCSYFEFEEIRQHHLSHSKQPSDLREKKKRKLVSLVSQKEQGTEKLPKKTFKSNKRPARRFNRRRENVEKETPDTNDTLDRGKVVNLSSINLTDTQCSVLALGPKFCPTPHSVDQQRLHADVAEGCRRVRLKEYHFDSSKDNSPPPVFYKPTGFCPASGRDMTLDAYCNTLHSWTKNFNPTKPARDNLNQKQKQALNELRKMVQNREVRISTADKGGAVVVQDVSDYLQEISRQLDNQLHYKKIPSDPTPGIARISNKLVDELHLKGYIDENTMKWA
jgi:hypothetical protein